MSTYRRSPLSSRGFTLTEIITVIGIGIGLSTAVLSYLYVAQERAKFGRITSDVVRMHRELLWYSRQYPHDFTDTDKSPITKLIELNRLPASFGQQNISPSCQDYQPSSYNLIPAPSNDLGDIVRVAARWSDSNDAATTALAKNVAGQLRGLGRNITAGLSQAVCPGSTSRLSFELHIWISTAPLLANIATLMPPGTSYMIPQGHPMHCGWIDILRQEHLENPDSCDPNNP